MTVLMTQDTGIWTQKEKKIAKVCQPLLLHRDVDLVPEPHGSAIIFFLDLNLGLDPGVKKNKFPKENPTGINLQNLSPLCISELN